MVVVSVRMKSSAVSVSRLLTLAGWDSAPSFPSGLPVLKKKGSAQAGVASHAAALTVAATNRFICFIRFSFSFFWGVWPVWPGRLHDCLVAFATRVEEVVGRVRLKRLRTDVG